MLESIEEYIYYSDQEFCFIWDTCSHNACASSGACLWVAIAHSISLHFLTRISETSNNASVRSRGLQLVWPLVVLRIILLFTGVDILLDEQYLNFHKWSTILCNVILFLSKFPLHTSQHSYFTYKQECCENKNGVFNSHYRPLSPEWSKRCQM